ncbi:MAG: hypothetical protein V9G19_07675 [Tetrasphaera sp.]
MPLTRVVDALVDPAIAAKVASSIVAVPPRTSTRPGRSRCSSARVDLGDMILLDEQDRTAELVRGRASGQAIGIHLAAGDDGNGRG